jgi:predicted nucleic acid-binding protein
MMLFDSSAAYAMADQRDRYHKDAVSLFSKAIGNREILILHSYVVVEAAALLQRRLGIESAKRFLAESRKLFIHWVTREEHQRGVDILEERGRRHLSLVDCVSFVVMASYGINTVFAFDGDFEEEGFTFYRG